MNAVALHGMKLDYLEIEMESLYFYSKHFIEFSEEKGKEYLVII